METNTKPTIKQRLSRPFRWIATKTAQRPFTMFIVALVLFLVLMGVSSAINKPKAEEKAAEKPPTEVSGYYIGTSPKVQVQAQVKKEGVITIQAQTAGIVQQIYKKEGDKINKGNNILWISSNYNGGTISTAQRQLAEASYNSTKDNLATNKDAIAKQRQVAELSRENAEELRKITDRSLDETRGVIETNDGVLHNLVANIEGMQATGSATPAQIDALKAQQAQLQSGINQLRNANRNAEYQANTNNAPTQLADLQKDLALKQLDLQEKALNLQLEVSRLSYVTAQISEAFNYPASPYAGTIERINVTPGQMINPGDILATINTNNKSATLESFITQNIAKQITTTSPSIIYIDNAPVEIVPSYVSTQPTNGSLYSIKYQIPAEYIDKVNNNNFIKLEIAVGTPNTSGAVPFIPIDAVYQTQDGAYVYTAEKADENKTVAKTKKIILGQITGNYVEVLSGLTEQDIVIIDRNVLEGDAVQVKKQG